MSSGRWTCDVIILHSLEGQQSDLSLMTHCLVSLFSVFGGPIRCRSCHGLYCSRGLDGRLGETVVRFHGLLPRLTKTSPGWTEQSSGRRHFAEAHFVMPWAGETRAQNRYPFYSNERKMCAGAVTFFDKR